MKQAIDVLVANIKNVGIPEDNPYFFASKSSSGYLDSWQAMNTIVQEAGSSGQNYLYIYFQLFDLTPGELELRVNHMGHDINIHKDIYHLHDSAVEIAKVSRLLLAINSGNAATFQGKRWQDSGIDDLDDDLVQEDEKMDINSEEDVNRTFAASGNMEEDNDIESGDELKTTLACGGNIQEDEDADIESEENLNRTLAIGRNTNIKSV
ncbi:hypothetical protein ACJMK2_039836 [Sinanodonta woodiana]|uniref:Uncharacterized protein n=1 Tax=Sinanodonta woodiana TaxID=1069815 RepID=A0ABD3WD67_SINWO